MWLIFISCGYTVGIHSILPPRWVKCNQMKSIPGGNWLLGGGKQESKYISYFIYYVILHIYNIQGLRGTCYLMTTCPTSVLANDLDPKIYPLLSPKIENFLASCCSQGSFNLPVRLVSNRAGSRSIWIILNLVALQYEGLRGRLRNCKQGRSGNFFPHKTCNLRWSRGRGSWWAYSMIWFSSEHKFMAWLVFH